MSDLNERYINVPDEDRKKAAVFFDRAAKVGAAAQYEYAIDLYLQGLKLDPESIDAHQALREIALRRKAAGGKPKGIWEAMKLSSRGKDDLQNLLNAEELLSFDPGERKYMLSMMEAAFRLGAFDTTLWIANVLLRANIDHPKPDFNIFLKLRDHYSALRRYEQALECVTRAQKMKPDDMDLAQEVKNLSAQLTMQKGNYETAGSFRDSIRDAERQRALIESEKDVVGEDHLQKAVREAEEQLAASPDDPGKIMKLVEALRRTGKHEAEERAINILRDAFERTGNYRFKLALSDIRLRQLQHEERAARAELLKKPNDPDAIAAYKDFTKRRAEEELAIFQEVADQYPTELRYRYEIGNRLMALDRPTEAIPLYQQALQDAKLKVAATLKLGQAFLAAEFPDEAVDTLRTLVESYEIKGDDTAKEIHYWFGRALEEKGELAAAVKSYSQVAQWDFTYKDVQTRIKALRKKMTESSAG